MLDKLPPQVPDLLAPYWVFVLGFIGAAVGYFEDFKLTDGWKVWLLKALTKCSSSALAAVLTYHALEWLAVSSQNLKVVLIGIAGHMGIEALRVMGEAWKNRAQAVK